MTGLRLEMSPAVVDAIGRPNARILRNGGAPPVANCWRCGVVLRLRTEPSTLSVVLIDHGPPAPIELLTLFAHHGCHDSKVLTHQEFKALPSAPEPTPPIFGNTVYVDGDLRDGGIKGYLDDRNPE